MGLMGHLFPETALNLLRLREPVKQGIEANASAPLGARTISTPTSPEFKKHLPSLEKPTV